MYLVLDSTQGRPGPARATRTNGLADEANRGAVLCARCAASITHASLRTTVAGEHEHTFFNPAGIVYRVACFAAAPGCSGTGEFSGEFTWFPGHRWQIAICGRCTSHLGWHFQGPSTFSALIMERIRQLDLS